MLIYYNIKMKRRCIQLEEEEEEGGRREGGEVEDAVK